jgi:hypothetical protein
MILIVGTGSDEGPVGMAAIYCEERQEYSHFRASAFLLACHRFQLINRLILVKILNSKKIDYKNFWQRENLAF